MVAERSVYWRRFMVT